MEFIRFIKNWTLPLSMLMGIISYFVYVNLPFLLPTRPFVSELVSILQPCLIFLMLFISFCKVNPRDLRPSRMHLWMMLIQIVVFCLLALPLILFPETKFRVVIEAAMICMITPTATAAAVVTGKLGGNAKSLISYTIIINIASSLIVPLVIPIIHPSPSLLFLPSFLLILGKVFPMLIFPFLAARAVQLYLPKWHKKLLSYQDLAFYLWSFALVIAIAVTVRSIMHSHVDPIYEFYIAVVALLCCMGQFAIGRWIGKKYHDRIGGGQSLGQKNTVFSIWLGANFLSPVTALAGGFYTIWHNVVNSYQLYKRRKLNEEQTIAREI